MAVPWEYERAFEAMRIALAELVAEKDADDDRTLEEGSYTMPDSCGMVWARQALRMAKRPPTHCPCCGCEELTDLDRRVLGMTAGEVCAECCRDADPHDLPVAVCELLYGKDWR